MVAEEAEAEVQRVLWRAVMFILALVGIGVNALIFVILGGHGHSHHGHSHDHGHEDGHGHGHSHGKGSGCNGNRVRSLCPLRTVGSFIHMYLNVLSHNECGASALNRCVSWPDPMTSIVIGKGGAVYSQLVEIGRAYLIWQLCWQDVESGEHAHEHSHGEEKGHSHSGDGDNINLRGAIIHVLGDFVQSIGVAIAGALIWWKQVRPWSPLRRTSPQKASAAACTRHQSASWRTTEEAVSPILQLRQHTLLAKHGVWQNVAA